MDYQRENVKPAGHELLDSAADGLVPATMVSAGAAAGANLMNSDRYRGRRAHGGRSNRVTDGVLSPPRTWPDPDGLRRDGVAQWYINE